MTANVQPVADAAVLYGDQRAADQKAIDQLALDAANQANASLVAEYEAYKKSHPDVQDTITTLAGMSYGGNTDPSAFEAEVGNPVGVWRLYFQGSEVAKAVTAIATAGAKGRKVVWISFKLPASWADMGKGLQDAWVKDMGKRCSDAAVAVKVTVCTCLHHEPEGDGPLADYQAMQKHCLPLIHGLPNLLTSIILTGYPQQYGGTYAAWTLEACYPGPSCDVIGVDPYLMYGTYQDYNKTPPMVTSWTPPDACMKTFADFAKAKGCDWAVAETGQTNEAYNAPPAGKDGKGFLAQQFAKAKELGAKWYCYFASTLNSRGSWEIDSAEAKKGKRAALAEVNKRDS